MYACYPLASSNYTVGSEHLEQLTAIPMHPCKHLHTGEGHEKKVKMIFVPEYSGRQGGRPGGRKHNNSNKKEKEVSLRDCFFFKKKIIERRPEHRNGMIP